jgi:putative PIN family toxin of toxin-antitoxin system
MRVVADTNTVVSGLLWHGPPRQLLDAARAGTITLVTTAALLELARVQARPKFAQRIERAGVGVEELVETYGTLAEQVTPADIPPTITADPDDDAVLAAAAGGRPHRLRRRRSTRPR